MLREKTGRWSEIDEKSKPPSCTPLNLFENILSIRLADFSVILLGNEIAGKNDDAINEFRKSFV